MILSQNIHWPKLKLARWNTYQPVLGTSILIKCTIYCFPNKTTDTYLAHYYVHAPYWGGIKQNCLYKALAPSFQIISIYDFALKLLHAHAFCIFFNSNCPNCYVIMHCLVYIFENNFVFSVLVAEIVAHFLPKMVEIHNYSSASSQAQKLTNWDTLNSKFPSA